ncbi:MAG TPA: hypothetical protein VKR56_07175 [Candidatus Cybelea sp.]|nr:hypothetical protein [Candidatus Cybelea sp.]
MSDFTRFIGSVGKVAIAGLLAGCAGVDSVPSNAASVASSPLTPRAPIADKMKCPADNGVSVHPCRVRLTASKTTAIVKTKGPKGGWFIVRDPHCTSKGIVTVTQSRHHKWTITAGTAQGLCAVKFVDKDINGKKIGVATLGVENEGS